jgi:hypothetical protein
MEWTITELVATGAAVAFLPLTTALLIILSAMDLLPCSARIPYTVLQDLRLVHLLVIRMVQALAHLRLFTRNNTTMEETTSDLMTEEAPQIIGVGIALVAADVAEKAKTTTVRPPGVGRGGRHLQTMIIFMRTITICNSRRHHCLLHKHKHFRTQPMK